MVYVRFYQKEKILLVVSSNKFYSLYLQDSEFRGQNTYYKLIYGMSYNQETSIFTLFVELL